ncbi:MAG TPA: LysM domain-containing protein [Chthonomonadaceae bacterium]|nr:LysM domain-containing protein [Chthonomonadaceae bacterium]
MFEPAAEAALDSYNEALDLAEVGDSSAAADKMRMAIAADPSFVDAYVVLGKLVAQTGASADLEEAIRIWQRARFAGPTEEQAHKIDTCTMAAEAHLVRAAARAAAQPRNRMFSLVAGGVAVAAASGFIGYVLKPPPAMNGATPKTPAARATVSAEARPRSAPKDPVAAISAALNRPDVKAAKIGDTLYLQGRAQTETEKNLIVSAAAFAAHTSPEAIDASGLKVKGAFSPVAAARVEKMLRLIVGDLSRNPADPLHDVVLSVRGGQNHNPLKVTGTAPSGAAAPEIVRLVKEIYPSANPVDVSGLIVRSNAAAELRPPTPRTADIRPAAARVHAPAVASLIPALPRPRETGAVTRAAVQHPVIERPTGHPAPRAANAAGGDQVYINLSTKTYTVQPGDTVYAIARKYGRDASQSKELLLTNRDALRRPNAIPAGTVLKLPPGWKPPKQALDENE